ncbi:hypothetical protein [Aliivibrio kagoshimensis]|uniref:hypothetical protein n=1 Tax=Aliivibrio kagoshimensis TaxID=2910230 RepID=UPI003D13012A
MRLCKSIQSLILDTRKQWISTIVNEYRIEEKDLWKYYGYDSKRAFYEDLMSDSEAETPT